MTGIAICLFGLVLGIFGVGSMICTCIDTNFKRLIEAIKELKDETNK